jgi:hypothetical protein
VPAELTARPRVGVLKRMNFVRRWVGVAALFASVVGAAETPRTLPLLRVSENNRFLVQADGAPFFWLGDTAWELFHRLSREEASLYLRKRAEQGFTVVQAVVLAEVDGLTVPNANGHTPLTNQDPLRPDEAYFAHVDWVLTQAASAGLYIGLLPTWGDKWNKKWGAGPEIFNADNAAAYGEWLGRRYGGRNVIWILGGDRPIENDRHRAIINAMARGLRRGDGGRHLITLHPNGGHGSAEWFHGEDWLDFNMRQNGHVAEFTERYVKTRADYERTPVKPVVDGEPIYEDHPLNFKAATFGHSTATDVRRPLYWNLFSGAFGHTYGHHSVWQMWTPARKPINAPLIPWQEALDRPGARQMQHARRLLESRPFLTRIPADDIIVPAAVLTAVPGEGRYRFAATRDANGSYAMVYVPTARKFSVRLEAISGGRVRAWWFNPRDGTAMPAGDFPATATREFLSPNPDDDLDWVLVLDDATKNYPAPGAAAHERR